MQTDMPFIDLRSDTVTLPTPAMRKAMAEAEVGDDVYGEDPTINRLQELSAELLGKQAALFVASGTMGNLAAVLATCQRGDEAIMGHLGHTFLFEAGGISALGGVFAHTLPNQLDGTIALTDLEGAVRAENIHHPRSRLVILENTHNRCGGVAISCAYTDQVGAFARENNLHLHLDGARIFNAAATIGTSAKALAAAADSVTFCLSKGLCAPVGSVLCGSNDFIHEALRIRKQLGGGMRQAGILAAAGIVALQEMVARLEEDHANAAALADLLTQIEGLELFMGAPQTNMVFIRLADTLKLDAVQVKDQLKKQGILVGQIGERDFRLVTHYWVKFAHIPKVAEAFRSVLQG